MASADPGSRVRWQSVRVLAFVGLASPLAFGCGAHGNARAPATEADRIGPAAAVVSDEGFASAVHDLLLTHRATADRAVRLGAVEARQMTRSESRFKSHAPDRGLSALSGGLYLVHVGEQTPHLLGPRGPDALKAALREFSIRGDEGRARALYDLLLPLVAEPERSDVTSHLSALDAWTRDAVAAGGPVASTGALERIAVRRRLLEPSDAALGDAAKAVGDWIARAVVLRDKFRKTRSQPPRDEGAEAWRALETGPLVLASLYLRDANAAGAVAALDVAHAREILESERPQFAAALAALAKEPSADRCIDLLAQLRPLTGREQPREEEDFSDDRDLFGAAAFAVATECYRLDPTLPQVALTLGVALEELGMAEAAPSVLAEAVQAHPEARVIGEALALSLDAIASEEDAGDPDAARRAFAEAQPILVVASQRDLSGKLHPNAARLRAAMGEIEMREGRISEARVLLKQSADEEKSGGVLLSIARIDWRDGHTQAALDHLRDALTAHDASRDPALRGEILLMVSDVTREKGDVAAARTPLADALKDLVQSRNLPEADARARAERVLARVLDRFGATQSAQRAVERAYAAAPGDKRQATQTVELAIGRAFVRGDIASARDGLRRAVGADLDASDLVYFALWVRLLERQLRIASDGEPDRVFTSLPEDGTWVAALARFGESKLKPDELILRAKTPMQKYEALFYSAMDRRATGDTKGGDDLLRQVVAGTGLQLSEVSLARDILDPTRAQAGGPLPPDVSIP